jgi:hypothetical protein
LYLLSATASTVALLCLIGWVRRADSSARPGYEASVLYALLFESLRKIKIRSRGFQEQQLLSSSLLIALALV